MGTIGYRIQASQASMQLLLLITKCRKVPQLRPQKKADLNSHKPLIVRVESKRDSRNHTVETVPVKINSCSVALNQVKTGKCCGL